MTATGGSQGSLAGRLILLGVTGSIAAYKAAEVTRALQAEGADVQVLMTHTATRFVGSLTFETLTRRRAMLDPLELLPDRRIAHIVAADTADAILVAPATARWLAAMASGLADDVVTATCLASAAPVVVAPAMDGEMYAHPATRANVERLTSFGYHVVPPEIGPLASGASGQGRLAETTRLVDAVRSVIAARPIREPDEALRPPRDAALREPDLEGLHVVVTAGGTAEAIDPVRYIGNRSTGRMGVAVAEAALARGARVTLIHGMTSVRLPDAATLVHAPSADELRTAVLDALPSADVLVMAAAVADFRPRRTAPSKLTRDASLTLELEPTPDILAEAATVAHASAGSTAGGASATAGGASATAGGSTPDAPESARDVGHGVTRGARRRPVLVGFAAETGSLDRAVEKARRKRVDLLVANDVTEAGSGFGTATNRVTLVSGDAAPEAWPLLTKREVAERLLDRVAALLGSRSSEAVAIAPDPGAAEPAGGGAVGVLRSSENQRTLEEAPS